MKIKKLVINNFRQFYKENSIEFSTSSKNITVVHGENGGGKTTLLNAFKWVLYEVTDLDSGDDKLLNQQAELEAAKGSTITMSVMIEFEHDNLNYVATRTQYFAKGERRAQKQGHAGLELTWVDPDPNKGFQKSDNPEVRVKQMLPKDLHKYFFFHGERIEQLVLESDEKIKEAIKSLMGINVVERAHEHLAGPVQTHFRKELKKNSTADDADILERIERNEQEHKDDKEKINNVQNNIIEAKKEISIIDHRMSEYKPAEELQKRRETVQSQITSKQKRIDELEILKRTLVNVKGMLPLIWKEANAVYMALESKRKKGELPFRVRKQFIEDLIENKECICGTSLYDGSDALEEIQIYLTQATSSELEEVFLETSGSLKHVEGEAKGFIIELRAIIEETRRLEIDIRKLDETLDEISNQIGALPKENIADLEEKRKQLGNDVENWLQELGRLKEKINRNQSQKQDLTSELNIAQAKTQKEKTARDRYSLAVASKDYLEELIEMFLNELRKKLSEQVEDTVTKILKNQYIATIDENFMIKFEHNTPAGTIEVPDLSSGQKVVAGLSFIASIISIAKDRYQADQKAEYFPGGLYPLVMDTPFGNADDEHSENIANYIPELADQVIIFASNKNWSEKVQEICAPRIGKEFSLIHYSANPKDGVNPRYEKKSTTGFEYSKIDEGFYGR